MIRLSFSGLARHVCWAVCASVAVVVLLVTQLAPPAAALDVNRIAGASRTETAAAVADTAFPDGADVVLLARSDDFADGLAASSLAGAVGAPLLLTSPGTLDPPTRRSLERLSPREIIILGGSNAVSEDVARSVEALTTSVRRVSGSSRADTAARSALLQLEESAIGTIEGDAAAFVVNGSRFADALSVGGIAYQAGLPVLLTEADALGSETAAALGTLDVERVVVVGGTAVVSPQVVADLRDQGLDVTRVSGPDRTATAAAVADLAIDQFDFGQQDVVLARGNDFADGLGGASLSASLNGVMLLTSSPTRLGGPTAAWLGQSCATIANLWVMGGESAINTDVVRQAEAQTECSAPVEPTEDQPSEDPTAPPDNRPAPFPDEDSTGVPAGHALTPSGGMTITTDGTVIDGLDIDGCLRVRANDVTIRRTRITATATECGGIQLNVGYDHSGILIEDVEIDGLGDAPGEAIAGAGYTARRVNIHGVGDGLRMDDNTVVEDSFIHSLVARNGAHNDGIQSTAGSNITIRGNRIVNDNTQTSAILIKDDLGVIADVTIENNFLDGGGYTLYVRRAAHGGPSDVTITNNVFGDLARYGLTSIDVPVEWSGNTRAGSGETVEP